jgi:hypothetical protein
MPANLPKLLPACFMKHCLTLNSSCDQTKGLFFLTEYVPVITRCPNLNCLLKLNNAQNNLLVLPAPRSPYPKCSLFKLAKPVHQGEGQTCVRDENWVDFPLCTFAAYWTLSIACPSAEVKFCLAKFLLSLCFHSLGNTLVPQVYL